MKKNGRVITGRVQAHGAYVSGHIGSEYSTVTFALDNGDVEQLKSVTVPPILDSFFTPGLEGEFFFHQHGKRNTLLALKSGGRNIFKIEDAKRVFSHHLQIHVIFAFIAALFFALLFGGIVGKIGDLTIFALFTFLPFAYFTYITRIGARYLRPKKAEELVRSLGF